MFDNTPFLTLIYIADSHQRKGFGKQAILCWENEMRGLGYIDKGGIFFDNTPFVQPQEMIMLKII